MKRITISRVKIIPGQTNKKLALDGGHNMQKRNLKKQIMTGTVAFLSAAMLTGTFCMPVLANTTVTYGTGTIEVDQPYFRDIIQHLFLPFQFLG